MSTSFSSRLRRLAMPSSVPPATTIRPPGTTRSMAVGDRRSRSARDAARSSTSAPSKPSPSGRGDDRMPASRQRIEVGAEALDDRQRRGKPVGQAEARLGAEEQHLLPRGGSGEVAGLEGVEQGPLAITAHGQLARAGNGKRARTRRRRPFSSSFGWQDQAASSPSARFSRAISLPVSWSTTFIDRRTLPRSSKPISLT